MSVSGLDDLLARTARAHDGILDFTDVNRDLVNVVMRDVREPHATGAMAASRRVTADATGWGVTYGEPYAINVHWGTRIMRARPWLWDAATSTEDAQLDALTNHVQQLLD